MTGDSANFADALHFGHYSTAWLWIGPSLDRQTPKSLVTAFLWCNSLVWTLRSCKRLRLKSPTIASSLSWNSTTIDTLINVCTLPFADPICFIKKFCTCSTNFNCPIWSVKSSWKANFNWSTSCWNCLQFLLFW